MTKNQTIDRFIAECCTCEPDAEELGCHLYAAFTTWAETQSGRITVSPRVFAHALKARGFIYGRRATDPGRPRYREGIRLASASEQALSAGNHPVLLTGSGSATEPAGVISFPPTSDAVPTDAPPSNLTAPVAAWWSEVNETLQLSTHHRMTLTLAAQTWDRAQKLDRYIREHGTSYVKRNGDRAGHPEVAAFAKATSEFRQLVRELGLDLEGGYTQPPRVQVAKGKR